MDTDYTVHQWANLIGGLAEVRRVTRGPVVFLTCDPALLRTYWLHEYSPEVIDIEAARYPPVPAIAAGLGGVTTVTPVPIPLNCTDGFNDAYYGRPEMLLSRPARLACSAWSFVEPAAIANFETHLARDLADGTWDARHGRLRSREYFEGSLVSDFWGPIEKTLPRAVDCSYTQRTFCYKVIRGLGARQQLPRFHAGLGSGST